MRLRLRDPRCEIHLPRSLHDIPRTVPSRMLSEIRLYFARAFSVASGLGDGEGFFAEGTEEGPIFESAMTLGLRLGKGGIGHGSTRAAHEKRGILMCFVSAEMEVTRMSL